MPRSPSTTSKRSPSKPAPSQRSPRSRVAESKPRSSGTSETTSRNTRSKSRPTAREPMVAISKPIISGWQWIVAHPVRTVLTVAAAAAGAAIVMAILRRRSSTPPDPVVAAEDLVTDVHPTGPTLDHTQTSDMDADDASIKPTKANMRAVRPWKPSVSNV